MLGLSFSKRSACWKGDGLCGLPASVGLAQAPSCCKGAEQPRPGVTVSSPTLSFLSTVPPGRLSSLAFIRRGIPRCPCSVRAGPASGCKLGMSSCIQAARSSSLSSSSSVAASWTGHVAGLPCTDLNPAMELWLGAQPPAKLDPDLCWACAASPRDTCAFGSLKPMAEGATVWSFFAERGLRQAVFPEEPSSPALSVGRFCSPKPGDSMLEELGLAEEGCSWAGGSMPPAALAPEERGLRHLVFFTGAGVENWLSASSTADSKSCKSTRSTAKGQPPPNLGRSTGVARPAL